MRHKSVIAFILAVLVGCGEEGGAPAASNEAQPGDPGVVHVHGLGRDPADGALMIATHTGLFRLSVSGGPPKRIADRYQDTMGFTVVGPKRFLGSGHPADLRVDPPFLGLIETRDGGETWRPISLRGQVDFHVLEAQGRTVYGFGSDFESREPRFLRSNDGGRTWTRLQAPESLLALAIDPRNPRVMIATGEQRGYFSRDGGARWAPLDIPGGLVAWTREAGVVAVDLDGVVRRAQQPDGKWEEVGDLQGSPSAFEGAGGELLAATHDSEVLSSKDGGRNWSKLLGE